MHMHMASIHMRCLRPQLDDVSSRLRAAAVARHAAQLHSTTLSSSLTRLYSRPPSLMPGAVVLSSTPPHMTVSAPPSVQQHEFIGELRRDVRYLERAVVTAGMLGCQATEQEARQLLHALLHGLFGDLSQPTDCVQLGSLLSRLCAAHLHQLCGSAEGLGAAVDPSNAPTPAGGVTTPRRTRATSFLPAQSLLAELARGFFRMLPQARRFLYLGLAAPLDTILAEGSLELALPISALAGDDERPPDALAASLAAT